jgi:type VI secretion system protein ImpE
MDAATLVSEGRPLEALTALENEVRAQPAEAKHRVFLFQLLSILGQWDRAANQLKVAAELDASMLVLANVYRSAIRAEMLRLDVFQGRRSPMILGEPDAWIGDLMESVRVLAAGGTSHAAELRDKALDAAPAVGGAITIGEGEPTPFEWVADCDSRLGPVAEMVLEGKYHWVPLSRVQSLRMEAPTDLRDLIWIPCEVIWTNGGEASALIPARYPGVDSSMDSERLMSRSTTWEEPAPDYLIGQGARVFVTDSDEVSVLHVRGMRFDHPPVEDRVNGG